MKNRLLVIIFLGILILSASISNAEDKKILETKKVGEDKWYADDEYMENPKDDRAFLRILFEDFMKQIEVRE